MQHSGLYSQPTHMSLQYIVRIKYKVNHNGVKISGAGMTVPQCLLRKQVALGSIPDHTRVFVHN